MHDSKPFPPHFLWGAATSAYQIEGSPLADGAGQSIWHRFSHTPGLVHGGDTGDLACDHYRRRETDLALMAELGLGAYRFSIAWARVLPRGRGRVNPKGLGFYERLVDGLLARGITPMVTLYHWDLPSALDDRGGWLNPDSAGWFADYASVAFRALDDRVGLWVTLNEPWVITDGGYLTGAMAPGHRNLFETPLAAHNLLRAHGQAVAAYRALGHHQIGIAVNLEPKYPASQAPQDRQATERAEAYMNRQYLDPVLLGRYPEALPGIFGEAWPAPPDSDMEGIARPIDFVGINYYTRSVVRGDPGQVPTRAAPVPQPGAPHTDMGWEVYPQGLCDVLEWVSSRYARPAIYITENGAAFPDPPPEQGRIDDPLRVAYLREHLCAARRALSRGVDLRGYFVWSLLDNFEWAHGYSKRFGIVHVDPATQVRTPKASARFYTRVIRSHGGVLHEV